MPAPPSPLSHLTHSPPFVLHKWFLHVGVPVFVALWGESFELNLGLHMSPQDCKHRMQPAAATKADYHAALLSGGYFMPFCISALEGSDTAFQFNVRTCPMVLTA